MAVKRLVGRLVAVVRVRLLSTRIERRLCPLIKSSDSTLEFVENVYTTWPSNLDQADSQRKGALGLTEPRKERQSKAIRKYR